MFVGTVVAGDLTVHFRLVKFGEFHVTFAEHREGKTDERTVTGEEFGVMMAGLCHPDGLDGFDGRSTGELYATIDGVLSTLPNNLRPVP